MLSPPIFEKFPSLYELAQKGEAPLAKREKGGLFDALLGKPEVLYYELLEDPTKFDDSESNLIIQLIVGSKSLSSLSDSEQALLDQATLSWAQSRSKPQPKAPEPTASREALKHLEDEEPDLEWHEGIGVVPTTESVSAATMPTYWWR